MSGNIVQLHPELPTDEPVMVLIDANVRAVKLFKALAEAGFAFTFDHVAGVLRISERSVLQ